MRHLPAALVTGFIASALTTTLLPLLPRTSLTGQLLAGDPIVNRQYPTTLNIVHDTMAAQSSFLTQIGSMGWWIVVACGTVFFSVVFLRLLRRYA